MEYKAILDILEMQVTKTQMLFVVPEIFSNPWISVQIQDLILWFANQIKIKIIQRKLNGIVKEFTLSVTNVELTRS